MKFGLLKRKSIRWLLIVVVLDALFFGFTDPAKVAPLWLIVGFLLAVTTVYWLLRGFLFLLGVYVPGVRSQHKQLTKLLTTVMALLIGMQSMGQLTLRDVLVLLPLVILGYFYLRYNRRTPQRN